MNTKIGTSSYNTISHHNSKEIHNETNPTAPKDSTKRSGTTGGTCSGIRTTPGGVGPLHVPNGSNVYTSNEKRRNQYDLQGQFIP